jgi:hypothetical protein
MSIEQAHEQAEEAYIKHLQHPQPASEQQENSFTEFEINPPASQPETIPIPNSESIHE